MSLEKRLTLYVVAVAAVISAIALVLSEQGGRITIFMIILAGLSLFVINRSVRGRFHQALRDLAQRTGLEFVDSREHPIHQQFSREWAMGSAGELGAWDKEGQLPYVAGEYKKTTVTVRIPTKVDHDRGAEATCFSAHYTPHKKVHGFTVYHRESSPKLPGYRTVKLTGDEDFDAAYVVAGRESDEINALLTREVRTRLQNLTTLGVRGLEFNARGLHWYEPGKACDLERMVAILDVLNEVVERLMDYEVTEAE